MTTPVHARYWAEQLQLRAPEDRVAGLARSLGNSRVDPQPHQIDAALFSLKSPLNRGVLLADEVGLGKTIEAGLVIAQRWAQRRRRVLLIVPATLRKQWQLELASKFHIPSNIVERKTAKVAGNPFDAEGEAAVIASYEYVYRQAALVQALPWDLVVVDEAHRLRSVYKETKKAQTIVDAIRPFKKLLLTATPLQNSLLELYGLVSILDDQVFGDLESFKEQFTGDVDTSGRDEALKERIAPFCTRTLRRQVRDHIQFTDRIAVTAEFTPSSAERQLYDLVSDYLQRESLAALPNSRRKLITMILRKLLASSSAAIGATLAKFVERLEGPQRASAPTEAAAEVLDDVLASDFEATAESAEEWPEDPDNESDALPPDVAAELRDLRSFVALAKSIGEDAKARALLGLLRGPIDAVNATGTYDVGKSLLENAVAKGARRKVVIFTESRKTQDYLFKLLSENGFDQQIVLINGTNTDDTSKRIYGEWRKKHSSQWEKTTSGSKSADMKAAIVEEFRERATILLATESAAEGVNLQFCSIVVNYDLPWNPQRIEQRIGRCHRYGQECDVLVVNFLNKSNEADQRVYQLLSEKFRLFDGVFGASDDVLGILESGVDIEKSIGEIYQRCRTTEEVRDAFDELRKQLDDQLQSLKANTRRKVLDNFDEDVQRRLGLHADEAKLALNAQQEQLLDLARYALRGNAEFETGAPRFRHAPDNAVFDLRWEIAEKTGAEFFRTEHPLAQQIITDALREPTAPVRVRFQYATAASAWEPLRGVDAWLEVSKVTIASDGDDDREEHLLLACVLADGRSLEPDLAAAIFRLPAAVIDAAVDVVPPSLVARRDELVARAVGISDARLAEQIAEESDKLERWSDDLKETVERPIRDVEKQIAAHKKEKKRAKAEGIPAQLEWEQKLQKLKRRYDELFLKRKEEHERIDERREGLIETMMASRKRDVRTDRVFLIQFTVT